MCFLQPAFVVDMMTCHSRYAAFASLDLSTYFSSNWTCPFTHRAPALESKILIIEYTRHRVPDVAILTRWFEIRISSS